MTFDIYFIIALIISVTIHEFCHAWTATYLGDPTPKYMGRLTLNPLAHFDPLGTLMMIYARFGWGKPVPFNISFLKNPRIDAALIAISGPISNFVLALIFAIPYRYIFINHPDILISKLTSSHFVTPFSSFISVLFHFLQTMIGLNLVLMVFNLLPIPPLDGSKIFSLLIPGNSLPKLYQYRHIGYGLLILLIFSDVLLGRNILHDFILRPIVDYLWNIMIYYPKGLF